ncbi:MAG: hypothetical protein JO359_09045 [Candidatus Eremiobacteraeota bacterium]|nr:hypothetical protein [Candidatus Eremiobacteraeota bacterium]
MRLVALALGALLAATTFATAQTAGTLTGKVVDVATYVTKDHNMDSMKGHAMSGGDHAMGSSSMGSMKDEGMKPECGMLGVLANGKITLVSTQMGSETAAALCKSLNKTVTLSGKSYTEAGMTVFLVDSVK